MVDYFTTGELLLHRVLQQYQREIDALLETNRDISSILDVHQLLALISHRAIALLNADQCIFFDLHVEDQTLRPMAAQGVDAEQVLTTTLKVGQGLVGRCVAANQALIANDIRCGRDQSCAVSSHLSDVMHTMVTPLVVRGRLIGAMQVSRLHKLPFDDNHLQLFVGFAQQAAVALENARLYQELEAHAQRLEREVEARVAQVRQQASWLRAILGATREAIIVIDDQGRVQLINAAALELWDVTEAEILYRPLSALAGRAPVNPPDWPERLTAETVGEVEIGGRTFNYSVSALEAPVQAGFVCVLTDITALHRLDSLKTQVIQMASHDLRSPITALNLQAHLLRREPAQLSDSQRRVLDRMETTLEELQRMVSSLLNLENIERQARGLTERVSIPPLIRSLVDALADEIEARGHTVQVTLADPLPMICGDLVRLMEAIRNLLTNAIKYTPAGGQITVAAFLAGDQLYIEVTDNGIGIASDELPQVFQPGFRASTAIASAEPGTGFGLSLVKRVAEQHGGDVKVISQPGMGSTFSLCLPVELASLAD